MPRPARKKGVDNGKIKSKLPPKRSAKVHQYQVFSLISFVQVMGLLFKDAFSTFNEIFFDFCNEIISSFKTCNPTTLQANLSSKQIELGSL